MQIDVVKLNAMLPTLEADRRQVTRQKPVMAEAPPAPSPAPATEKQLSISFDKGQIIVYRFLDKETGDLIQQIPPEEVLRVVRSIQELLQNSPNAQQLDVSS